MWVHKKIKQAMDSLYKKYPDFYWALDKLEFLKNCDTEYIEKLCTDGTRIIYHDKYLYYIGLKQVEEEILHMMFHKELFHNKRFLMYPEEELRNAIMDLQVAWMMNESGMLRKEKRECLEYLLITVCNGKCDFSLYHELQEDKERKERFLNYMSALQWDNHRSWEI